MSPGRDMHDWHLFTFKKKNVPVHVAKLREAPKLELYQFGTERRTLGATA